MRLRDREEAGRRLARLLVKYKDENPVVLALPRGGVPVGFEIARTLSAPLDVLVVRKLGVPGHEELGVGAVAEGGQIFLSPAIMRHVGMTEDDVSVLAERQATEVERRVRRFRGDRSAPDVRDRTVILVDDGIATGGTVHAALRAVRARGPRRLVLAVPVAAAETLEALRPEVDDLVALLAPEELYAIGLWYEDFRQVDDEEVLSLLAQTRHEAEGAAVRP